jgi:hypothetical protein
VKAAALWWSFFWISNLLTVAVALPAGALLAAALMARAYSADEIRSILDVPGRTLGYAVGAVMSIVAVRLSARRHLPSLVALAEPAAEDPEGDLRRER